MLWVMTHTCCIYYLPANYEIQSNSDIVNSSVALRSTFTILKVLCSRSVCIEKVIYYVGVRLYSLLEGKWIKAWDKPTFPVCLWLGLRLHGFISCLLHSETKELNIILQFKHKFSLLSSLTYDDVQWEWPEVKPWHLSARNAGYPLVMKSNCVFNEKNDGLTAFWWSQAHFCKCQYFLCNICQSAWQK